MLYNEIFIPDTKDLYEKPQVAVYDMECEGVICTSGQDVDNATLNKFIDGGVFSL